MIWMKSKKGTQLDESIIASWRGRSVEQTYRLTDTWGYAKGRERANNTPQHDAREGQCSQLTWWPHYRSGRVTWRKTCLDVCVWKYLGLLCKVRLHRTAQPVTQCDHNCSHSSHQQLHDVPNPTNSTQRSSAVSSVGWKGQAAPHRFCRRFYSMFLIHGCPVTMDSLCTDTNMCAPCLSFLHMTNRLLSLLAWA